MQLLTIFAVLLTLGEARGQTSSLPTCSGSNPDPTDCILDHVTMKVEQLAAFNSLVIKKTNDFEKVVLDKIEESCSSILTEDQVVIQKVNELLSITASRDAILLQKIEETQSATASRDENLLQKVEETQSATALRDATLLQKVEETQSATASRDDTLLQKVEETQSATASRDATLLQKVEETQSVTVSRNEALFQKVVEIQSAIASRDEVLLQKVDDTQSRDEVLLQKVEDTQSTTASRDEALFQKVDEMLSLNQALFHKMEQEHNNTKLIIREVFNKIDELEKKLAPNASNCLELFQQGRKINGVYTTIAGQQAISVFCDMDTSNGGPGWTVFQQRKDGTVSFNRTWDDYRSGFGTLDGDHWLGNSYLALITQGPQTYQLRIDMWDWENAHRYAEYSTVQVLGEDEDYKLLLGSNSGDAGDSMAHSNNRRFSTPDRDNDDHTSAHCAQSEYWAGWWYGGCAYAALNNPYHHSSSAGRWQGIFWNQWHGTEYSLKQVQMKLRPVLN